MGAQGLLELFGAKFVFTRTAWYIIHMLKLQCHYASLGEFYKLNVWIVLESLYSKVMVIFAMRPAPLYDQKFVFSITAQYIIHMLKLQCHLQKPCQSCMLPLVSSTN